MAIIRSKRYVNFTVIDNCVFEDGFLSYEARGLLSTLLSKPDNWKVNISALSNAVKSTRKESGERVIYNILNELIAAGFVDRKKHASGSNEYIVYDNPNRQKRKQAEPQTAKTQIAKNANCKNPDVGFVDVLINTETTTRTEKEIINTEGARKEKSLPAKKATRIPDDWSAGEKELMFAKSYGFTPCEAEGMAIMFFNYFSNKTGKGSEWIDWHKTWQNWVIRESKSLKRRFSAPSNDNDFDFMAEMMRGCVNG